MKLKLGAKIGLGFAVIILLAAVQGVMNYRAMQEGMRTMQLIAEDHVPLNDRVWSLLVTQMRYLREMGTFSNAGDENGLAEAKKQLEAAGRELAEIEKLNAAFPLPATEVFLQKYKTFRTGFIKLSDEMVEGVLAVRRLTRQMNTAWKKCSEMLLNLNVTMTETQQQYIAAGELGKADRYAANLAATARIINHETNLVEKMNAGFADSNPGIMRAAKAEFAGIFQDMDKLRKGLLREECRQMFDRTRELLVFYETSCGTMIEQMEKYLAALETHNKEFVSARAATEELSEALSVSTRQYVDAAFADFKGATARTLILVGLVFVIGVIVSLVVTRLITAPLIRTERFAVRVAGGELDSVLDVYSGDEVGHLADSLRGMVNSLKENISEAEKKSREAELKGAEALRAMNEAKEAQEKAERAKHDGMLDAAGQLEDVVAIISSAAAQLSARIEESDHTASESALRLEESATAMNEMNATVQEVARNASSAADMSVAAKEKAGDGARIVRQSLDSVEKVRTVSLELSDDMGRLNEHAKSISQIMTVISDIADQTNLLALNAAIEAARAGEAGRGFAVVADEVRKLAEKTMKATQEVGASIQAIQQSTAKSSAAVENAVEQIEKATEFATQAEASLEEILRNAEMAADEVGSIAAASEEQSAASDEINRAILNVNDMSRQTAGAMGEAARAVSELVQQAQALGNLIETMKRG